MSDMNGVLAAAFDRANAQLRTTDVAGTSNTTQKNDENGAWQGCFDVDAQAIRIVIIT